MSGWVGGRLRFCNNYQALYIKLDSAGSRSVCRCYRPLQGGLCGGGGYGDLWLGQAENADNVIPFVNYGNGNFCPVVELLSLVSPVQSSLLPPFIPHLKSPSNVISFAFIIIICGIPERFTSPHSPHFKVCLSVSRKWRWWWWAGGVWKEDDDCIYMHSIPQSEISLLLVAVVLFPFRSPTIILLLLSSSSSSGHHWHDRAERLLTNSKR